MKTVDSYNFAGKRALIRVDFNVPLNEKFEITDDTRIQATLPTIRKILADGGSCVLMSHLGRPKDGPTEKYSLKHLISPLSVILGISVKFADDCIGASAYEQAAALQPGEVLLLENLRFYKQEEKGDVEFAEKLSKLGDVWVNDAFGTAHRAHASTEGVTHFLKSAAGFLLGKEIEYLGSAVENPAKPFMVILGGAKVSDKIGMIENLLPKADAIIVGGGMAYTFLKAQGRTIGNSKLEKDKLDLAKSILTQAKSLGKDILLPVDNLIVETIGPDAKTEICQEDIPDGKIAVDIGPKTIKLFKEKLKSAKTVVWNGPLGIFEMPAFSQGTREVAGFIAGLECTSIIGGGDTAAAIVKFNLEDKMTHISTGGGASLEYLEGKVLPGVAALSDK